MDARIPETADVSAVPGQFRHLSVRSISMYGELFQVGRFSVPVHFNVLRKVQYTAGRPRMARTSVSRARTGATLKVRAGDDKIGCESTVNRSWEQVMESAIADLGRSAGLESPLDRSFWSARAPLACCFWRHPAPGKPQLLLRHKQGRTVSNTPARRCLRDSPRLLSRQRIIDSTQRSILASIPSL